VTNLPEDGPPHERAELRAADTERPPALGAPVEMVATASRPSTNPFSAAENESIGRTQDELALLRRSVDLNTMAVNALAGKVDRFGHELGDIKTFSSVLALDAAQKFAKPNGLTGRRVLVVEDNPDLLEVLDRLLCTIGCNVIGVTNRADAEKQLATNRKRPFHAALVDIRIPLADGEQPRSAEGVELLRWLTAAYPSVARIGVSGDLSVPGLGQLSFVPLPKPLTHERLEKALYCALGIADADADTMPPPPAPTAEIIPIREPFPGNEFATMPSTDRETPEAKARE